MRTINLRPVDSLRLSTYGTLPYAQYSAHDEIRVIIHSCKLCDVIFKSNQVGDTKKLIMHGTAEVTGSKILFKSNFSIPRRPCIFCFKCKIVEHIRLEQ